MLVCMDKISQSKNELENIKILLDRKSKEIEIIKQISNQINKSLDLNLIASSMLSLMNEFFGFKHSMILLVSENKKHQSFNGKEYIMETGLVADLSIVKAWKGDKSGNLIYRKTARNFNPVMATAGKITIAEVEELCEVGELDPDQIHTPGIYVNRILEGRNYTKAIENLTLSEG